MTQSNPKPQITYSLEDVLLRLEEKIDKRFENLENKIDALAKDVTDIKVGQAKDVTDIKVGQVKLEGDIKAIDTRLINVEKTVDEIKADTKKNTTDLADLKRWRQFIVPLVIAVVAAALTGVINWAIRK